MKCPMSVLPWRVSKWSVVIIPYLAVDLELFHTRHHCRGDLDNSESNVRWGSSRFFFQMIEATPVAGRRGEVK